MQKRQSQQSQCVSVSRLYCWLFVLFFKLKILGYFREKFGLIGTILSTVFISTFRHSLYSEIHSSYFDNKINRLRGRSRGFFKKRDFHSLCLKYPLQGKSHADIVFRKRIKKN